MKLKRTQKKCFSCDGKMKYSGKLTFSDGEPWYEHRCSKCRAVDNFTTKYPIEIFQFEPEEIIEVWE